MRRRYSNYTMTGDAQDIRRFEEAITELAYYWDVDLAGEFRDDTEEEIEVEAKDRYD